MYTLLNIDGTATEKKNDNSTDSNEENVIMETRTTNRTASNNINNSDDDEDGGFRNKDAYKPANKRTPSRDNNQSENVRKRLHGPEQTRQNGMSTVEELEQMQQQEEESRF